MGYQKIPQESGGGGGGGPIEATELLSTGVEDADIPLVSDGSGGVTYGTAPSPPYQEGTFNATWGQSVGVVPVEYGNIFGSTILFIRIPPLSGTASSTAALTSNAFFPTPFRPSSTVSAIISVNRNGTMVAARAKIGTNGVVTIYAGANEESFTSGETFAIEQTYITYVGGK